jgi:2-phosphosulfolactate phosphatase
VKIEVILTPAEIALLPARDLSATTCVVFDVLRATSTILTALNNGARRVWPVATIEEARALREKSLPDALLGGERRGQRIEGFDLGNSPREYTAEAVGGRDIIMTTTNGTVALRACAASGEVHIGSLLNLDALAARLLRLNTPDTRLLLVCAGSGTRYSLEDALAAGALLSRLTVGVPDVGSDGGDAGRTVRAVYEHYREDLAATLRTTDNGRRLAELGLAADVDWCSRVSVFDELAMMIDGAIEGARGS